MPAAAEVKALHLGLREEEPMSKVHVNQPAQQK